MLLIKNWNPSAVRFELGRFNWLGSINSEVALAASWHTTPHKTAKDLFEKELIVGATNGIDPETTPRLLNALIGTRFKVITGYPGVTEVVLAMERGEVQGIGDWSISSIKAARPDWLRDGKINLLMQIALQKDRGVCAGAVRARFRQERRRPQGDGALSHAEDGGAADDCAAGRAGGPRRGVARGLRGACDRQGVSGRCATAKLDVAPVTGEEVDKVIALITSASAETAARLGKAIASER